MSSTSPEGRALHKGLRKKAMSTNPDGGREQSNHRPC